MGFGWILLNNGKESYIFMHWTEEEKRIGVFFGALRIYE